MSHRKRVRRYWNRVAREKRAAEMREKLNALLKQHYFSMQPMYPDASALSSLMRPR